MALLLEDGRPLAFHGPEAESFVWRGTLEAAALREFLADVAWGQLDVLLVDLPPGMQRFAELAELWPSRHPSSPSRFRPRSPRRPCAAPCAPRATAARRASESSR